jgi:hypothetical protein
MKACIFQLTYIVGIFLLFILGRCLHGEPKPTAPKQPSKLLDSQDFKLAKIEGCKLQREHLYQAAVQMIIHTDTNSWTRLYNFLTASSILILAWSTVYASTADCISKAQVEACISLPGLLIAVFWAPFGSRNRRLHRRFSDVAVQLENGSDANGGPDGDHGVSGSIGSYVGLRYFWIERKSRTQSFVIWVPLLFAAVFWFLLLKAIFLWPG